MTKRDPLTAVKRSLQKRPAAPLLPDLLRVELDLVPTRERLARASAALEGAAQKLDERVRRALEDLLGPRPMKHRRPRPRQAR